MDSLDFSSLYSLGSDSLCVYSESSPRSSASSDLSFHHLIGILEEEEEERIRAYREIPISLLLDDEERAPCPWRREAIVREDPRFEVMFNVGRHVPAAETTPGQTIDPKLVFARPEEEESTQNKEIEQDSKVRRKKKTTNGSGGRVKRAKPTEHSSTRFTPYGYRKASQNSKI